ncbi:hypothetical protein ZIOFF_060295 [Zingiber officinale]|uniref:Uncharacterized protein n=1 Tax=Zingiber officinale TaxID=94328 RepID=A0A8J5FBI3_ZINOF|nr:hypothetical protein ZIOFF_060295 [Zingiber officinale]
MLGQSMLLDESYCCASCGKVSGIMRCWKRQTYGFKELHQIVEEAKAMLETIAGHMDGMSAQKTHGIANMLSINRDVQKICFTTIEKADEWLSLRSNGHKHLFPAAYRIQFEEINVVGD